MFRASQILKLQTVTKNNNKHKFKFRCIMTNNLPLTPNREIKVFFKPKSAASEQESLRDLRFEKCIKLP